MPPTDAVRPRLGIIVNPLAGLGGTVALKGSDGPTALAEACARGAIPSAPARAARALRALSVAACAGEIELVAGPGAMGTDLARAAGFAVRSSGAPAATVTSARDTRAAALAMREAGVQLLLFAGGDGTARDIHDAIGDELPLLGIPAGVKMHSGVFARSPEAAAWSCAQVVSGRAQMRLRRADIADVDESAARAGRVASVLHGSALVPDLPGVVLPMKAASVQSPGGRLEALCQEVARDLEPGRVHLIGPGSTTALVLEALGERGTLLGVDAVRDGRVIGRDLSESQILALLERHSPGRLIVGLVGGQGTLFGRGNRQLSPAVLSSIGRARLTVLSAADKLLSLAPQTLWVDTGDAVLDERLSGYIRVHVGPGQQVVMGVSR